MDQNIHEYAIRHVFTVCCLQFNINAQRTLTICWTCPAYKWLYAQNAAAWKGMCPSGFKMGLQCGCTAHWFRLWLPCNNEHSKQNERRVAHALFVWLCAICMCHIWDDEKTLLFWEEFDLPVNLGICSVMRIKTMCGGLSKCNNLMSRSSRHTADKEQLWSHQILSKHCLIKF